MKLKYSFLISLFIHIILLVGVIWLFSPKLKTKKSIVKSKISLDLKKFQTLPPKPKTAPKQTVASKPTPSSQSTAPTPKTPPTPKKPITAPTPKKEIEQKTKDKQVIKKEVIHIPSKDRTIKKVQKTKKKTMEQPKQNIKKVVKEEIKKLKPKKIVHKLKPKKRIKTKPKQIASKSSRARPKSHRRVYPKGPNSRMINSLYGSSYSRMSSAQRRFIDRYLRQIIIISQRTLNELGYPREAIALGQQGVNIVEFWLYPNGDIRGLRLKRRLRSESLNRQTIEVIKTAYMYYPRPPVKTKIIIYVGYRLR